MSIIDLNDIWVKYANEYVLRGINLRVEKGEFIGIRGKSGVGKTSLVKIIGLLLKPERGSVKLLGVDTGKLGIDECAEFRLKHIGIIYQLHNLIPTLTVRENLELPMYLLGIEDLERKERISELARRFGVSKLLDRMPETLSGGERQRVAVIRALVNKPEIILADEPTTSLDESNSKIVIDMLNEVNKDGVTIIYFTTDFNEDIPSSREFILRNGILNEVG